MKIAAIAVLSVGLLLPGGVAFAADASSAELAQEVKASEVDASATHGDTSRALRAATPIDTAKAVEEIYAAVAASEYDALNVTGMTYKQSGTGVMRDRSVQGVIDLAGNMLRQDPKVVGGPMYYAAYWVDSSDTALFKVDLAKPLAKAALKLLKKPKARWLQDTSIISEDARRWKGTLLPGFGWGWYSDPAYVNSVAVVKAGEQVRDYVINHSNPYYGVKSVVTISLDNNGRVVKIAEVAKAFTVTYNYSYTSKLQKVPNQNLWVDSGEYSLAEEALQPQLKLKSIRELVSNELLFGATKEQVVRSVSGWVERLNAEWRIDAKWAAESKGAKVWVENPFSGKQNGLRFIAVKNGLVKVTSYSR